MGAWGRWGPPPGRTRAGRTTGVTASFFKELLRKATLAAVEAGREQVDATDLDSALEELLDETAALTRVLLGSGQPGESAAPSPHAWMEGVARHTARVERLD